MCLQYDSMGVLKSSGASQLTVRAVGVIWVEVGASGCAGTAAVVCMGADSRDTADSPTPLAALGSRAPHQHISGAGAHKKVNSIQPYTHTNPVCMHACIIIVITVVTHPTR